MGATGNTQEVLNKYELNVRMVYIWTNYHNATGCVFSQRCIDEAGTQRMGD